MAVITTDLVKGNGARFGADGWELVRNILVTGVDSSGLVGHDVILEAWAMTELSYGDSHPSRESCTLREVTVESVDADQVSFRVTYRDFSVGFDKVYDVWEFDTNVAQEDVYEDKDGNAIKVGYTFPSTYKPGPGEPEIGTPEGRTVAVPVVKMTPELTIRITKVVETSPESLMATYNGKINSAEWRGYAARTVLCFLSGKSLNNKLGHYEVTYTFQIRPTTWVPFVVFFDKNEGRPVSDFKTNAGNGGYAAYTQPKIYNEVDFAGLGLT